MKKHNCQSYLPGGANMPTWEAHSEYDWTVRLRRRCSLVSNYFDHLLLLGLLLIGCNWWLCWHCEGFQFAVAKFFIFFLTLFLVTLCAAAVCFAASATVRVFALANLLAVCVFIFMMVGLHDIFHLFCQLRVWNFVLHYSWHRHKLHSVAWPWRKCLWNYGLKGFMGFHRHTISV